MSNRLSQLDFELKQLAYEALYQAAQLVADLEHGEGKKVSEVMINTNPTLTIEEQLIDAFLDDVNDELGKDSVLANVAGEALNDEFDDNSDAYCDCPFCRDGL